MNYILKDKIVWYTGSHIGFIGGGGVKNTDGCVLPPQTGVMSLCKTWALGLFQPSQVMDMQRSLSTLLF